MNMQRIFMAMAAALVALPVQAGMDMTQMLRFGPTGYALLTVALFAILWRFLRPHKHHRRNADKWPWQ